jgi:hypothetical protein
MGSSGQPKQVKCPKCKSRYDIWIVAAKWTASKHELECACGEVIDITPQRVNERKAA